MAGPVITTRDGHVGVVELDVADPTYLDPALTEQLADAVATLDDDPRCRAVVLASTGKHFCAGADFGVGGGIGPDRPAAARRLYAAAARLFDVGVPLVAAVRGAAVGAGLGLACAADLRVATPSSRLHANFTRLGFHPGFGLTATLPAIVGTSRARDLFYSGRPVSGSEAAALGLVDRLVDDGGATDAARAWAAELAEAAPLAVRSVKATLDRGRAAAARAAMEHELAEQTWLWDTEDCRRGLEAAARRGRAEFVGR